MSKLRGEKVYFEHVFSYEISYLAKMSLPSSNIDMIMSCKEPIQLYKRCIMSTSNIFEESPTTLNTSLWLKSGS